MTETRELMGFFEKYYGETYSGVFRDTMAAYLDGRSADFLRASAQVLVRRFSRTFGRVPGHAEFETHMSEILASMPKRERLPEPRVEPELSDAEREEFLRGLGKLRRGFGRRKVSG